MKMLGIGPGDEVILPPYTFVATLNVILMHYALPIFVDSDLETFQIDAGKIEAAITSRTRARRSADGTPLILATKSRYSETLMSG